MKKLTHKYAAALMLLGAVAGVGVAMGTTTAHASINTLTSKQLAASNKKIDLNCQIKCNTHNLFLLIGIA